MAAIDVQITESPTVEITHASVFVGGVVTEQINGTTIGTVASGDTNNQVIINAGGVPVGTSANPSIVANSPLSINGSSIGSVAAEASKDITVNLNGSPSGSWDGDSWEVTFAKPVIALGVYSDAGLTTPITTANFNQTVYVNIVPTDITPTSHTFYFDNGSKAVPSVTQAGATYAWTVDLYGSVTIGATATDGSDATADATPFTLTVALNITKSMSLDGVNDYNSMSLQRTNSEVFSITCWVKLLTTASDCPFVSIVGADYVDRPRLGVGYRQSTGNIEVISWNDFWVNIYNVSITADTNWHHIAITYNPSTPEVKFYYDGTLGVTVPSSLNNPLESIVMGWFKGWPAVGARYGNFRWTDLAVHNTELSAGDVTALQTLGTSSGDEIQRWSLITESSGQTTGVATDILRGNNCKLYDMTTGFGIVTDAP